MKRRALLSTLAIMFTMLVMSFATTTNEAIAQQNQNCCTYTVDIAGVPASCFPFNICSFWANGNPIAGPFNNNGVTVHNLPWVCPPSSVFFGASINCMFPIASFNNPVPYNINGCCLRVRIGFDVNGCVIIYVRPC